VVLNWNENLSSLSKVLESKSEGEALLLAVWGKSSALTQVTVVPAVTIYRSNCRGLWRSCVCRGPPQGNSPDRQANYDHDANYIIPHETEPLHIQAPIRGSPGDIKVRSSPCEFVPDRHRRA
jgi:hypothetical protein